MPETARLVTLTGPGGVGKTRLEVAVADRIAGTFADGVGFVDLAPLPSTAPVHEAIAGVLGVREEPGRPWIETLQHSLGDRSLLLVLDNCEHLLDSCRTVSQLLLSRCRNLRILATSRQPLGIDGERVWRVPSLSLPPPVDVPDADLMEYEASGCSWSGPNGTSRISGSPPPTPGSSSPSAGASTESRSPWSWRQRACAG